MTPFGIAGVQMHVTVGSNLEAMRHRIDLVMHLYPWVQMIVFSELCVYGPLLPHAQPLPGESEDELCTAARRHGIWLVNGSMFERRDGHIHNTTSVIDPQGTVIGRYRKLYPFMPFEQGVTPGEDFLCWDIPGTGRFGVLNCYDIWFPENARALAAQGVEVILHPVLTHTIDRDVDLCIARATAAMQQCYVFDINGLGAGGNGYSAVFDPHGRALYEGGGSEQFIPVEIDLDQVRRSRQNGLRNLGQTLKSFRDRRVDYPFYARGQADTGYLDALGALEKPAQGAPLTLGEPRLHGAPPPKQNY